MWLFLAVCSAFLLGLYDVAKKYALRKNGTFAVLLVATALSTLFVSPFLRLGPVQDHLKLCLKAVLVTSSWVSGMEGLKRLPLTTVSTIKGSRPVLVVLFCVLLFGEQLNVWQWLGVAVVIGALFLLGRTSRGDGTVEVRKAGFLWMGVSVVTGVLSALYDKHIMQGLEPLFVQSWTNLYITVLVVLCWTLLIVAVLITAADACYFFALKQPDALLSIISVIRRASVLVTFLCGALLFREKNLRAKAFNMLLLAAGVVLLLLGS